MVPGEFLFPDITHQAAGYKKISPFWLMARPGSGTFILSEFKLSGAARQPGLSFFSKP